MKNITILLFFLFGTIYCQDANFEFLPVKENSFSLKINNAPISVEALLQKYIQIPSVSGDEKEAGDFIKSVCKENGLIIADFGSSDANYNFAASIYPLSSKKPNIIFLNHLDVIPEDDDSDYGAYSGKIIQDRVYGRGAIDNKGATLMQLYGMIQFINSSQFINNTYNVTLLSVSCEETQCEGGIHYVVDNYFDLLNPAVVIGEGPSELTSIIGGHFNYPIFGISTANKSTFWLHLELEHSTSGHGSVTPLNYSNKEMVASLNKLTKKNNKAIFNELNINILKSLAKHKNGLEKLALNHPKLFKPILVKKLRKQPELFSLFSNTITLTNIYTNSNSFNKIPSKTEAFLDCRLLPGTDKKEFLTMIKKRLNNDSIKITIVENMPSVKPSSTQNIYYENLKNAITDKYPGSEILPIMLPNINDLGHFRAKNVVAFATIPVYFTRKQIESIHNKNEYISIELLYDGAEVYYNFINRMQASKHTKLKL